MSTSPQSEIRKGGRQQSMPNGSERDQVGLSETEKKGQRQSGTFSKVRRRSLHTLTPPDISNCPNLRKCARNRKRAEKAAGRVLT